MSWRLSLQEMMGFCSPASRRSKGGQRVNCQKPGECEQGELCLLLFFFYFKVMYKITHVYETHSDTLAHMHTMRWSNQGRHLPLRQPSFLCDKILPSTSLAVLTDI